MSRTYAGTIALEGEQVDVSLMLSPPTVRLTTGNAEIGAWPITEFRLIPRGDGTFDLVVEGEQVGFVPREPDRFDELLGMVVGFQDPLSGGEGRGGSAAVLPQEGQVGDVFGVAAPEGPDPGKGAAAPTETATDPGAAAIELPPPFATEEPPAGGNGHVPGAASFRPEPSTGGDERTDLTGPGPGALEPSPQDGPGDAEPAPRLSLADVGTLVRSRRQAPEEGEGEDGGLTMAEIARRRAKTRLSRRTVRRAATVGGVLAAVVVVALGVRPLLGGVGAAPAPSGVVQEETSSVVTTPEVPTAPATTVAPLPGAAPEPAPSVPQGNPVFERPVGEVLASWNGYAAPIASALRAPSALLPGPFRHEMGAYLALEGVVDPDGSLGEMAVVLDPAGPGSSDLLGLQALGIAVAVVQPDSSGGDRAAFLRGLGLDVSSPRLDGLDGSTVRDGVAYRLWYDGSSLRFAFAPGS